MINQKNAMGAALELAIVLGCNDGPNGDPEHDKNWACNQLFTLPSERDLCKSKDFDKCSERPRDLQRECFIDTLGPGSVITDQQGEVYETWRDEQEQSEG
jgi:hypothetical protein